MTNHTRKEPPISPLNPQYESLLLPLLTSSSSSSLTTRNDNGASLMKDPTTTTGNKSRNIHTKVSALQPTTPHHPGRNPTTNKWTTQSLVVREIIHNNKKQYTMWLQQPPSTSVNRKDGSAGPTRTTKSTTTTTTTGGLVEDSSSSNTWMCLVAVPETPTRHAIYGHSTSATTNNKNTDNKSNNNVNYSRMTHAPSRHLPPRHDKCHVKQQQQEGRQRLGTLVKTTTSRNSTASSFQAASMILNKSGSGSTGKGGRVLSVLPASRGSVQYTLYSTSSSFSSVMNINEWNGNPNKYGRDSSGVVVASIVYEEPSMWQVLHEGIPPRHATLGILVPTTTGATTDSSSSNSRSSSTPPKGTSRNGAMAAVLETKEPYQLSSKRCSVHPSGTTITTATTATTTPKTVPTSTPKKGVSTSSSSGCGLNFHGRGRYPSCKNIQMYHPLMVRNGSSCMATESADGCRTKDMTTMRMSDNPASSTTYSSTNNNNNNNNKDGIWIQMVKWDTNQFHVDFQ
jgi:hypothetical protein